MKQEGVKAAVDKIPPLDKGGTFTGPPWEEAAAICDDILKADGVGAVIDLLQPVDDGQDYKARYVLHAMAHYLGRPGKEAERLKYCGALASRLTSDAHVSVRGYLARQLQVVGGPESVPALGKALLVPEICEYAAQALLAIQDGAAAEFRKALPALSGPSRVTALQALGVLRDAESIGLFRQAAEDPETRSLAVWALANVGDVESVELVLKAADVDGYERVKNTSAAIRLAERLEAAGKKAEAKKIWLHLESTRKDSSEAYVRALATEALAR